MAAREGDLGHDPFNQNSNRSDREKWSTSKGGPVFSKLFRLDRTDPLSFGSKFPEILVEWIAPLEFVRVCENRNQTNLKRETQCACDHDSANFQHGIKTSPRFALKREYLALLKCVKLCTAVSKR